MALFILKNQHNQFLNRQLEWLSGGPGSQLFFSPHRDVVINQLIELNSRDITLRAEIISCEADAKGLPRLTTVPETAASEA